MKWSPQQDAALKAVEAWRKNKRGPQVFRLFGFAGTGKTTLAIHLSRACKNPVFAAFTGKAALVMRRKGCRDAQTIHRLIYKVDDAEAAVAKFLLNSSSEVKASDLVIVDECSMVAADLGKDLLSFKKKVLVLGDPAQLPPVAGAGYFTEAEPDFMLTEIHRQAQDNPIIRLSMDVREGRGIQLGDYGAVRVIAGSAITTEDLTKTDQVLVGRNATRMKRNLAVRKLLDFADKSPYPVEGEKLICLKNYRPSGLLNGGLWRVASTSDNGEHVHLKLTADDNAKVEKEVHVPKVCFTSELPKDSREQHQFTYGYAITVHKSQGSQWPRVTLFDESYAFGEDAKRWLYTGLTRASEALTIVK